ncbi:MAG: S41 family peptidase [Fimbriimonadaceae bacterium]
METQPPQHAAAGLPAKVSPWRTLSSGLTVVGLCIAVIVGSKVRDRVDEHRGPVGREPLAGLVASRQREAGGINLDAYYDEVEAILKSQYVDPITDDRKLAVGAVRGMVNSLGDPGSQFMERDAFTAYQNAQRGRFEGIGVDFYFEPNTIDLSADDVTSSDTDPTSDVVATRIPRLTVSSVIPGGPADKAGVKPGDWVDTVDGHWVIDAELIARYRKLSAAAAQGKASKVLDDLKKEIRDRADSAIMPLRALAILSLGESGKVSVTFNRAGGPPRKVEIQKAAVLDPGNFVTNGVIKLRFGKDAPEFLKSAIAGKGAVTIDLRGQPEGYFDSMVACLKLVGPSGAYGAFATYRKGQHPSPFVLTSGNPTPPKVTLLVDHSVRGPAAVFALALSAKGVAQLKGSEVSADRSRVVVEGLPDGSGYTLVTGEYRPATVAATRTKAVKS